MVFNATFNNISVISLIRFKHLMVDNDNLCGNKIFPYSFKILLPVIKIKLHFLTNQRK
jgi:dihydroorotase